MFYGDSYSEGLRTFWTPLLIYLNLLGWLLIFLGVALAGWASAVRDRERERAKFNNAFEKTRTPLPRT
jgi:hypothetical protein